MVRTVLLLAALIFIETTQWAAAQTMACTDRTAALRHLEGKFAEVPAAMGVTNTGGVLEVLTSESGESWTMLISMPDGSTCLVAAGQQWRDVPSVAVLGDGDGA